MSRTRPGFFPLLILGFLTVTTPLKAGPEGQTARALVDVYIRKFAPSVFWQELSKKFGTGTLLPGLVPSDYRLPPPIPIRIMWWEESVKRFAKQLGEGPTSASYAAQAFYDLLEVLDGEGLFDWQTRLRHKTDDWSPPLDSRGRLLEDLGLFPLHILPTYLAWGEYFCGHERFWDGFKNNWNEKKKSSKRSRPTELFEMLQDPRSSFSPWFLVKSHFPPGMPIHISAVSFNREARRVVRKRMSGARVIGYRVTRDDILAALTIVAPTAAVKFARHEPDPRSAPPRGLPLLAEIPGMQAQLREELTSENPDVVHDAVVALLEAPLLEVRSVDALLRLDRNRPSVNGDIVLLVSKALRKHLSRSCRHAMAPH